MGRQVPDHIDIPLKQSKINADAVDVKQLSELVAVDDILDFLNRRAEQVSMIDHQYSLVILCNLNQRLRFLYACGQRLLHEDVQPMLQTSLGQFEMRSNRSG